MELEAEKEKPLQTEIGNPEDQTPKRKALELPPQDVWRLSSARARPDLEEESPEPMEPGPGLVCWERLIRGGSGAPPASVGMQLLPAPEKLVDVSPEHPAAVEHMFKPPCASLPRGSGCCGDEGLHGVPAGTASAPRTPDDPSHGPAPSVQLTSQRVRCQCRPPWEDTKLGRRRPKGRGRGRGRSTGPQTASVPDCSPEGTPRPAPAPVPATLTYPPADTCPLSISQLYPR